MTEVLLPTLHSGQVKMYQAFRDAPNGLLAARCGRRFGKTDFCKVLASDAAIKRSPVGWFAPSYKVLSEAYNEIADLLHPIRSSASKIDGVFRTTTGGRIDFWTLENERAGRSRKYKLVIIDEGAFTKSNMMSIWEQAIKPTLLDLGGKCIVASNTNGVDPENFLYQICHDEKYGFAQFHATMADNPLLPLRNHGESGEDWLARRESEFAKRKTTNHPLVYQQEDLAEFVDWSGVAFFGRQNLLVDDLPVPFPQKCDAVYAVIDSATKTGTANDGTGVVYFAINRFPWGKETYRLVVLDWDLIQIEGSLLETWIPQVFANLEAFAKTCGARNGSLGVFIEDKSSGMILNQQVARRGWPAQPIDSKLTSVGKDERAISISGYIYRNLVKISQPSYERITTFKKISRNHLLGQIFGFRVGDKDAAKREDDLLDCFCYGVAIGLGNSQGF